MKQLFCTAIFSLIVTLSLAQTSAWSKVSSGTQKRLLSISFGSNSVGYISGADSLLLKTTNGGVSWQPVSFTGMQFQSNADDIIHINFVSATTGYAIASSFTDPQYNGVLYKTTDGGLTWQHVIGGAIAADCSYFFDEHNGHVGGAAFFSGYTITQMINGVWDNYHTFNFSPTDFILDIDFYNQSTGIASGSYGYVFRTFDGGVTWDTVKTNIDTNINSIKFLNASTILAATDHYTGSVIISTDTGRTWQFEMHTMTFFYPLTKSIAVSKRDSFIIVGESAPGQGIIIHQMGVQHMWAEPVEQKLRAVTMANDSVAYAVGDSGLIVTNRQFVTSVPTIPVAHQLLEVYPNPSDGLFTTYLKQAHQLRIYDATGRLVYMDPVVADRHRADLRQQSKGIYMIVAITKEGEQLQHRIILK